MTKSLEAFDFNEEVKPTEWLVDGLVPLGQIVMCLARSGQGKSYFCENLAVKVVCEQPFLGRAVRGGDVLLIDQDTDEPTVRMRLIQFGKRNGEPKHKLWLKSQENFNFSSKSIIRCIQAYPDARLVIIDTYHSVLGELDPNSTADSNHIFNMLKTECLTESKTIWINHHLTEKNPLELEDLMFGDSLGKAMGNSAIIQRPDAFFILCGNMVGGELKEICVRVWGKRAHIEQRPFMASFENNEFSYTGNLLTDTDECLSDLRALFYEHPEEGFKIAQIHEQMGKKHGLTKIYKYLSAMEKNNEVKMERGKSNQFRYFCNVNGNKPQIIVKTWTVEKIAVEKPPENSKE